MAQTAQVTEQVFVKKSDSKLQIVWGELYVPDIPDSAHDFMTRDEIMKSAYRWMARSETNCIDIEHNLKKTDAFVVESFIARDGDPDFIAGSWVIGVHVPDVEMWDKVEKGEFNGFSMYGAGRRGDPVEREVPAEVVGLTKSENGHSHEFLVAYGPDGEFIGGRTDEVDGHYHVIRRGTLTEHAAGHCHTFDFVRGVLDVESEEEGVPESA